MEKSFFKRIAVVFMALVLTFVMVPAPELQAATNVGDYTLTLTKKGTKPTVDISKNTSINLIATEDGAVIPSSSLKFKSSNKKIATVTNDGVVTGIKTGKTKINVTYKRKVDKKTVTTKSVLTVNVKEFIDVDSITLSNTSLTLTAGDTASLSAVVAPEHSSLVTWRSFIPEIATVDEKGNVNAQSPGIGVIAACAGTKTEVCRVTVTGGGSDGGNNGGNVAPAPNAVILPKTQFTSGDKKYKTYYKLETKGDDYILTLGYDDTLIPSGSDPVTRIPDFNSPDDTPWSAYITNIKKVEIAPQITSLGKNLLNGAANLTDLYFENSSKLSSIGESAFSGCEELSHIDGLEGHYQYPDNTISSFTVKANAFNGCEKLTNFYFPPGCYLDIRGGAFGDCKGLIYICIPCSADHTFYQNAFAGCTKLKNVFYQGASNDSNKPYGSGEPNNVTCHDTILSDNGYIKWRYGCFPASY